MQVQVFSPTELGVPTARWRKYTAFNLHPWVRSHFLVPFESLFFRNPIADAGVYLDAVPQHVRQAELQCMGKVGAGFAGRQQTDTPTLEEVMNAGQYMRLEGASLVAQQKGLLSEDGQWQTPRPFGM